MKSLRSMMMWMLVLGIALFVATSASAADKEHNKGNHEALIKTLRNSAAVLQSSQPDLAQGLTKYANDEASEIEGKEEKGMKEDLVEGPLVKLLRDSATALQQSHPDLAAKLIESADMKEKKIKALTEKNEKEEPGENVEPKSEQGENK
ncbi:MAG: hypothetical protein PHU23_09540 [Dehalococcoidales bacterium]|nr:hypothetical protein [Dehalococcoidales bacterium]